MKKRSFVNDGSGGSVGGRSFDSYRAYSVRSNTGQTENVDRNFERFNHNIRHFTAALTNNMRIAHENQSEEDYDAQQSPLDGIFREANLLFTQLARVPGYAGEDFDNEADIRDWAENAAEVETERVYVNIQSEITSNGNRENRFFDVQNARPPVYRAVDALLAEDNQVINQDGISRRPLATDLAMFLRNSIPPTEDNLNNAQGADQHEVDVYNQFISDAVSNANDIFFSDVLDEPTVLPSISTNFTNQLANNSVLYSSNHTRVSGRSLIDSSVPFIPLSDTATNNRNVGADVPSDIPRMILVNHTSQRLHDSDAAPGAETDVDLDRVSSSEIDHESQSSQSSRDSIDTNGSTAPYKRRRLE